MTTYTDSSSDTDGYPGAPRWVKVLGIIAIVVIALVILRLTGVVEHSHGPGRHIRAGHAASETAPANVEDPTRSGGADRYTPPERAHR